MVSRRDNTYPHLQLRREEPLLRRRPGGGRRPRIPPPNDPNAHGVRLRERLQAAREASGQSIGGFDERLLMKIEMRDYVSPEAISSASSGVEIVSQEEDNLVLAFATAAQLETFEARLSDLADGQPVTYANVIYAMQDFDQWTREDRTGWALRRDGFPDHERFIIDVELWPLNQDEAIGQQRHTFEDWLQANDGETIDSVKRAYLTIYRVRCSRQLAEDLLRYRDVRTVDLPPRIGLDLQIPLTSVQQLNSTPDPPDDVPGVVVLDSGLIGGHPLLAPAVGDAQSFIAGKGAADEHGHGTAVSGLALYDDIADCIRNRSFVPELRLFSGRILDHQNAGDPPLIHNQVDSAVRYFVDHYDCRVFNLCYGDLNKPYQGGRVAGLAVTLDALERELDVLFVVPTGNYSAVDDGRPDWRTDYPHYLKSDTAAIIDPAPALNVLTVGSLARYEQGTPSQRYPNDPAYIAVAKSDQPSPFTRCGPSVRGAIKPDLVDYGGNILVDSRNGNRRMVGSQGVGEITTSREFATGRPFVEESGTSFAAPRVANAAARLFSELPNASTDLCRALLVAHARAPIACADLYGADTDALLNTIGYGLVDRSALYRSLDNCVTLWAEDRIEDQRHHFYEVPAPEGFWEGGRRTRELTVSLAYRPAVRTTRIDYRACSVKFKLVQANSLDQAAQWFDADVQVAEDEVGNGRERGAGRGLTETARSRGTVQASTWTFTQPSRVIRQSSWFVVVTRNGPAWGESISFEREPYALVVNLSERVEQQTQLSVLPLYSQMRALLQGRARGSIRI